jgi:chromosome segregation ATPase
LTNVVDEGGAAVRFQKDIQKVEDFVREAQRAKQVIETRRTELAAELEGLRADLQDREEALPAHSVRPHQIMVIEELEEKIADLEKDMKRYDMAART